jgi:hypothetical protein
MKLDLNPRQVKVLDLLLGLDLETMGLNRGQQRVAHSVHMMLQSKGIREIEETNEIGLRVLRLTPSYRHSDK